MSKPDDDIELRMRGSKYRKGLLRIVCSAATISAATHPLSGS
jgi:hypothetical protein